MTLSDSFLSNAGWLFFAAWSVMVGAVSIVAFGCDLLPQRAHLNPAPKSQPTDQVRPRALTPEEIRRGSARKLLSYFISAF